jgi:hypothetical protein
MRTIALIALGSTAVLTCKEDASFLANLRVTRQTRGVERALGRSIEWASLLVALVTGCGARTSLEATPPVSSSGGNVDSGVPGDTGADSGADDGAPVTPCKAGVLAGGLLLPGNLVVGPDVYWVETGPGGTGMPSIQSCPKQGCTGGVAVTLVAARASGIVLDGAELYWAEPASEKLMVCNVSSCVPETLTTLDSPPVYLAVDATDIYIATYGSISRCPKAGPCAPTLLTSLGAPPVAVALDAASVYYIDQAAGALRACAKPNCDGGPRTVMRITDAYDFRVDDERVYVSVGAGATDPDDAGAVVFCPKAGCTAPTPLVEELHHPAALAIDAERVYWADQGTSARLYADGDIESCAKTGCGAGPTIHASRQSLPASVAVDDACVYWASDQFSSGPDSTPGSVDAVLKAP